MRASATVLIGCALAVAAGCWGRGSSQPLARFASQTCPEATEARRVAVLPLRLGEGVGRSAGAIDPALTASLRELDRYEVVAVSADRRDQLLAHDPVLANGVSSADLLRLREALAVDAVVIGRVDQFTSYDPLAMGLTVHLVSCVDGKVLWSATGHFDGGRADIQTDIERWHHGHVGEAQASIAGWRATLTSPSLFCRYVADRLVASIPYRRDAG